MSSVVVEYPENLTATLNLDRVAFEHEVKMAMASKLFEMGRLTSGQAGILAGIGRTEFLLECSRFGVSSVQWDNDEISEEFRGL